MDQVSQVREKIDLASLISEYLILKKSGRNFTTLCPFHSEKTPSFVISPERQIWHCFGCHKGGDCFTFLMEYENIEFPESLSILAKKAGIELKREKFNTSASKKEKLYQINHLASEFFHFVLTKHNAGKKALVYLEKRGVSLPLVNTYKIGFAPTKNALSSYLIKKKHFEANDLIEAGLVNRHGRDIFDFFKNRVVFPLLDIRGNVIGFSGRIIDSALSTSKYINTKDTILYHKGSNFFGIYNAKEEIKKLGRTIVVEGEFDVISCFKQGIKNVVAVKGTALTENQVTLLSRLAPKVILCFDMDIPGYQAVIRSLPLLEKKGLVVTVAVLQNAKDADEAMQKDPFSFKKAMQKDISIYDFLLEKTLKSNNPQTVEGKRKIAQEFLPILSNIENEIVKEHYLRKLSTELQTSYESIVKELGRILKQEKIKEPIISDVKTKKNRIEILEEYLLALIVQLSNPYEGIKRIEPLKKHLTFSVPSFEKLINILDLYFQKNSSYSLNEFIKIVPAELYSSFDRCYLFPIPKFTDSEHHLKEIEKISIELRNENVKNQMRNLRLNDEEKLSQLVSFLKH